MKNTTCNPLTSHNPPELSACPDLVGGQALTPSTLPKGEATKGQGRGVVVRGIKGDYKRIPNCLKKYRKARGLKQKEVAKILELNSSSLISRWEKGVCLPNSLNLLSLALLYRTPVEGLFVDLVRARKLSLFAREEKVKSKSQKL